MVEGKRVEDLHRYVSELLEEVRGVEYLSFLIEDISVMQESLEGVLGGIRSSETRDAEVLCRS